MAEENNLVAMTIEVVASYVAHNSIDPDAVPSFIAKTHAAIAGIASATEAPRAAEAPSAPEPTMPDEPTTPDEAAPADEGKPAPAVSIEESLASPDHIVSLIDGRSYKSLKRHLSRHGLTPAAYRERYGLDADYPMVAPSYSEFRKGIAHRMGFGQRPKPAEPAPVEPVPAPVEPVPAPIEDVAPVDAKAPPSRRSRKLKAEKVPAEAAPAKPPRRRRASTRAAAASDADQG